MTSANFGDTLLPMWTASWIRDSYCLESQRQRIRVNSGSGITSLVLHLLYRLFLSHARVLLSQLCYAVVELQCSQVLAREMSAVLFVGAVLGAERCLEVDESFDHSPKPLVQVPFFPDVIQFAPAFVVFQRLVLINLGVLEP